MRIVLIAMLLLVTACSSSNNDDFGGRILVAPGGYEQFTCAQMATRKLGLSARQKILTELMVKAGDGLGAQFVSAAAYQPEYISNKGELDSIRRAESAKGCTVPPGN